MICYGIPFWLSIKNLAYKATPKGEPAKEPEPITKQEHLKYILIIIGWVVVWGFFFKTIADAGNNALLILWGISPTFFIAFMQTIRANRMLKACIEAGYTETEARLMVAGKMGFQDYKAERAYQKSLQPKKRRVTRLRRKKTESEAEFAARIIERDCPDMSEAEVLAWIREHRKAKRTTRAKKIE